MYCIQVLILSTAKKVKLEQDTDFQKTIYPSRLSSMALNPGILSMGMNSTSSGLNERGNLAKLDLSDGNSLYAKLVVSNYI